MSDLSKKLIYAVDDEELSLDLIRLLASNTGARVETFRKAKNLLTQAQVQPADLYILDVMMPDMDGWELMEKLRGIPGEEGKPILFTTCLFGVEEAERINKEQPNCKILAKPLYRRRTQDLIENLLVSA